MNDETPPIKNQKTTRRIMLRTTGSLVAGAAMATTGIVYHEKHKADEANRAIADFETMLKGHPHLQKRMLEDNPELLNNSEIMAKLLQYDNDDGRPRYEGSTLVIPLCTPDNVLGFASNGLLLRERPDSTQLTAVERHGFKDSQLKEAAQDAWDIKDPAVLGDEIKHALTKTVKTYSPLTVIGTDGDNTVRLSNDAAHRTIVTTREGSQIGLKSTPVIFPRTPEANLTISFEKPVAAGAAEAGLYVVAKNLTLDLTSLSTADLSRKAPDEDTWPESFLSNISLSPARHQALHYQFTPEQLQQMGKETFREFLLYEVFPVTVNPEDTGKITIGISGLPTWEHQADIPYVPDPRYAGQDIKTMDSSDGSRFDRWLDATFKAIEEGKVTALAPDEASDRRSHLNRVLEKSGTPPTHER